MRKNILMLIIACCTAAAANAATNYAESKTPQRLITALSALYEKYGDKSATTSHNVTNPDTDMMEEKTLIIPIKVPKDDPLLQNAIKAFEQDKDCGYQYYHITPGERQNVALKINGTDIIPRESLSQEMWMLNTKNPDNPALRDNYTMVLDNTSDTKTGKIYFVTSMRPEDNKENITGSLNRTGRDKERIGDVQHKLLFYNRVLNTINDQIKDINLQSARYGATKERKELLQKLYNEASDIIAKMKAIVDNYDEATK